MSRSILICAVVTCIVMAGSPAFGETAEDPTQQAAPSWEAISESAQELAMERYSPEDLAAQAAQKQEHLESLYEQRAELEAQLVGIISATETALAEIDGIDDPVLRDESLLRFRSSKDVRLKTVRAKLDAVNETIVREQKELATLQRILQGRRAEARLYGKDQAPIGMAYEEYISREAARVRSSEREVLARLHEDRILALQGVVLPVVGPRVPDLPSAVMSSDEVAAAEAPASGGGWLDGVDTTSLVLNGAVSGATALIF